MQEQNWPIFLDQGCTGQRFFASGQGGAGEKFSGQGGQGAKSSGQGGATVQLEAFSGWGGVERVGVVLKIFGAGVVRAAFFPGARAGQGGACIPG